MSKANIDNLRFWIAQSIKNIFSMQWEELEKYSFSGHNIIDHPIKFTFKKYWVKGKPKTKLKGSKSWMNRDNLLKIWTDIKDKKEKYFLQQGHFYKTQSNKDTWIDCSNLETSILSNDGNIKDLMQKYKEMKNPNTACALIGGCRKWHDSRFITGQKYFDKNFLKNIKIIFNKCNLSHNNIEGEEGYGEKGKIYKKGKNEKLGKWTNDDFFKLCDCIVKFLDCFFAIFEIGDQIDFFASEAKKNIQ